MRKNLGIQILAWFFILANITNNKIFIYKTFQSSIHTYAIFWSQTPLGSMNDYRYTTNSVSP